MKKFFTLALACAFAASMSAQTTKYVKVQAEPETWEGTYLIVYEFDDDNNIARVFNGALEGKSIDSKANFFDVNNPYQVINGTPEVRVIESSEEVDAATFTVTKSATEGKYNVQTKSGYYIGYDSTEPGEDGVNPDPNLKYSQEEAYDNTIALQSGKTNVVVTSVNGFELRYNDSEGKERFRYHASGKKKAIKFYRQETVDELGNIVTNIKNVNVSENSDAIYNLAGQRVAENYRGVVVKNGKKILK